MLFVSCFYVSCSGSITSVGGFFRYRRPFLVIMCFLLGGVSSSSWCFGLAALFFVALPCLIYNYFSGGYSVSVQMLIESSYELMVCAFQV